MLHIFFLYACVCVRFYFYVFFIFSTARFLFSDALCYAASGLACGLSRILGREHQHRAADGHLGTCSLCFCVGDGIHSAVFKLPSRWCDTLKDGGGCARFGRNRTTTISIKEMMRGSIFFAVMCPDGDKGDLYIYVNGFLFLYILTLC